MVSRLLVYWLDTWLLIYYVSRIMTTQYMTWRISHGQLSVRLWDWGPHPVDEMIKMFFHLTWRRGHCVTCLFSGVDHDEREHVIIYVVWWNFLAQTMTLLDLPTQFRSFWIRFDSFIEMPYFSLYFVYYFVCSGKVSIFPAENHLL